MKNIDNNIPVIRVIYIYYFSLSLLLIVMLEYFTN